MVAVLKPASAETSAAPSPGPHLKVFHKLAYSLGQFAQSGGFDNALGFLFFYYTAVLGLSGALVGLALALSLAFDAVVDPLVGSISDGLRSRFGRRLPLMIVAVPLMPLALGFVFAPPRGLPPGALFAWLTASVIAVRCAISLFNVPYFALGAEMTEDYVERSSVVAYRAITGIVAGIAFTVMAYALFFVGRRGLLIPSAYRGFGWTAGAIVAVMAILCILGLRRYAPALPQPRTSGTAIWKRLPKEVAEIFGNSSFRLLFISAVSFYVAIGLNATLATHANVFAWKLPTATIQILGYALLVGLLGGAVLSPMIAARFEKKTIVVWGIGVILPVWTVLPLLWVFNIITISGVAAVAPLAINAFIAGLGVGFAAVAYPSMMADAADEHEYLAGTRREGLYFAGLSFAGKAASGLGVLVAGILIDLIGFPKDVSHIAVNAIPHGVLERLMLIQGPAAALLVIFSMALVWPYRITRARQREITQILEARRAEAKIAAN